MIKPLIHLNGTSAEELARQYYEAQDAVRCAIIAIRDNGPNARDYYPISDEAFTTARNEFRARVDTLEKVRRELEELYEHCQRAQDEKEARETERKARQHAEEIRGAAPLALAQLTRAIRRAPASLAGMHYTLEPGQRVRVAYSTEKEAVCFTGDPAENRIAEDFFPVPFEGLQLIEEAPEPTEPEKIATLNETFDRIAAERDKELTEEAEWNAIKGSHQGDATWRRMQELAEKRRAKRPPTISLFMETPDGECNHIETASSKSACFVQMAQHLFATFGAVDSEVWEAFAALENGEDTYRHEDFSNPEGNFSFALEEIA